MKDNKIIVAITQGDSNGIGYEVIIKALSDPRILDMFIPVVYGSPKLFGFYCKTIPEIDKVECATIASPKEAQAKRVNIINCLPDSIFAEPGKATPDSAKAAIVCLAKAIEDIKAGLADVLVTGPINKKAMSGEGFGFPGHTEYLQQQFGVSDVAMFMTSSRLRMGVVTGHVPLKDVPGLVTEEKIISKLKLLNDSLVKDFGVDQPRIGVLSLNPHSGDGGLLGTEEQDTIIPAIKKANEQGVLAFGPFSPDGYFGLGNYEKFDATLAMYHDQGLEPFKTLAFDDGVNFSAGLPVVRTSPDHGTAYELAGSDLADSRSMRAAIFAAIDIFKKRAAYQKLIDGKMPERRLDGEERRERPGKPQIA